MSQMYSRSPLRSFYNASDAQAAMERRALALRLQQQLGSTMTSHASEVPAMTDAEKAAAEKKAVQGGLKYLSKGNTASTVGPTTGSTFNVGAQPSGAETYPVSSNYGGIETTTYDSAGNIVGEPTVSTDLGGSYEGGASSDGSSSGSYLGAATGALAGYASGNYNNENDPDMYSFEDGFGRYNTTGFNKNYNGSYDNRAAWGGGVLGGVMGYFSDGYATPLVGPVVRWFHPYAQDMTRDVINFGDDIGGSAGAMMLDPIGTLASGKYSREDIVEDGLEAAASGGLSLIKNSNPFKKATDDCFLTTAAVEAMGLPDKCYELETLRRFRDTWLRREHPEDIETYYAIAPGIVEKVKKRDDATSVFKEMFSRFIVPSVKAIATGNNEKAYNIYCSLVRFVERKAAHKE